MQRQQQAPKLTTISVSSKRTLVSTFGGRHERFLPLPILRKYGTHVCYARADVPWWQTDDFGGYWEAEGSQGSYCKGCSYWGTLVYGLFSCFTKEYFFGRLMTVVILIYKLYPVGFRLVYVYWGVDLNTSLYAQFVFPFLLSCQCWLSHIILQIFNADAVLV